MVSCKVNWFHWLSAIWFNILIKNAGLSLRNVFCIVIFLNANAITILNQIWKIHFEKEPPALYVTSLIVSSVQCFGLDVKIHANSWIDNISSIAQHCDPFWDSLSWFHLHYYLHITLTVNKKKFRLGFVHLITIHISSLFVSNIVVKYTKWTGIIFTYFEHKVEYWIHVSISDRRNFTLNLEGGRNRNDIRHWQLFCLILMSNQMNNVARLELELDSGPINFLHFEIDEYYFSIIRARIPKIRNINFK